MTKQVSDTVEVKIIKTEEIRIQAKVKQFAKYAEIPEEQYIDKVIDVCARGVAEAGSNSPHRFQKPWRFVTCSFNDKLSTSP